MMVADEDRGRASEWNVILLNLSQSVDGGQIAHISSFASSRSHRAAHKQGQTVPGARFRFSVRLPSARCEFGRSLILKTSMVIGKHWSCENVESRRTFSCNLRRRAPSISQLTSTAEGARTEQPTVEQLNTLSATKQAKQ